MSLSEFLRTMDDSEPVTVREAMVSLHLGEIDRMTLENAAGWLKQALPLTDEQKEEIDESIEEMRDLELLNWIAIESQDESNFGELIKQGIMDHEGEMEEKTSLTSDEVLKDLNQNRSRHVGFASNFDYRHGEYDVKGLWASPRPGNDGDVEIFFCVSQERSMTKKEIQGILRSFPGVKTNCVQITRSKKHIVIWTG